MAAASQSANNIDAVLRRLWSEYLAHADAYEAVQEKYKPARAAFDAEFPSCPANGLPGHHGAAQEWLGQKHGLEPLWAAQPTMRARNRSFRVAQQG